MKNYVKPTLESIEIRAEECLSTGCSGCCYDAESWALFGNQSPS